MDTISQFLSQYQLLGLATGLCTFLIIGIFHPICIKCEYYFGTRCWWWFLLIGLSMCAVSVAVEDVFFSTLSGVVAFSSFWTIKEIFDQRKRVLRGWFPINPRRRSDYEK